MKNVGEKEKKPFYKQVWFWVMIVVFGLIGSFGSDDKPKDTTDDNNTIIGTEAKPTDDQEPSEIKSSDDTNYKYKEDEVQDDSLSVFDFSSGKESGQVDTGNLQLLHGQLLSVICNDGIVVVNAKIEPNLTNKMTIQQNYFNVGDLIKNHGFNTCKELQYWAVADMTNGEEEKVISFDLSKEVIEKIYDEQIYDNQIEDYVDNLYIHASLQ